jgi:hypothetical protein
MNPSTGGGTTTQPGAAGGASGGSSTSPSASPSDPGSKDLSKITSKAECDRAGGMWMASAKKCEKK